MGEMAAVLLCAASLGSAQDLPPGRYNNYGAGLTTCGTWLAERGDSRQQQAWSLDHQWVLVWVSAAGYYYVQGGLRDTDANSIAAWVDKYCRENPLNKIKDAAKSLVTELSKTK